jgi:AbrB family looped-hinge helix DNA binding protein
MSTTARIRQKGQVTIPTRVREQAGLRNGDLVEVAYQRGKIVITSQTAIDRSQFPNVDDEYTPAQRRIIDARIVEALEDVKQGRTYSPFDTAEEMIASMLENFKKRAEKRANRKSPR